MCACLLNCLVLDADVFTCSVSGGLGAQNVLLWHFWTQTLIGLNGGARLEINIKPRKTAVFFFCTSSSLTRCLSSRAACGIKHFLCSLKYYFLMLMRDACVFSLSFFFLSSHVWHFPWRLEQKAGQVTHLWSDASVTIYANLGETKWCCRK